MTRDKTLFKLYAAEFLGTALFITLGISLVIMIWGTGSPVPHMIASVPMRKIITGFLVGFISSLIALSPVGKISGAHTNPAVSFAFWRSGKMKTYALFGYVVSQMLGALVGALPLLLWDKRGSSIRYGSTVPGAFGLLPAFLGELVITAIFVSLILIFTGSKKMRGYTPFISPFFYGFMVWAEGALSGCSANPARSFGPAMISGNYGDYWIYLVAPIAAAILVGFLFNVLHIQRLLPIEAARISHHDCYSPDCLKTN